MQAWYLIYTKPQQEQVAFENLTRQHYRSYLPLVRLRKRHRGRGRTVVEPMFPRYLFVHLSDIDNWGPIRSTKGVSHMIRFGMTPAMVPQDLIEAFRSSEDETGVHSYSAPEFQPGDRVVISEGPMTGYEAIFTAPSGKERVLLLLEIAGKTARLQVGADQIEPVS